MRFPGMLGPDLAMLGSLGVTSYSPPQSAVPAGSGGYINSVGSIVLPWSFAANYAAIRTDFINALRSLPLSNVTSQNNVVFPSGQWSYEVMGCPQNAYSLLTYVAPTAPVTVVAPPTTPTPPPTAPTAPGTGVTIDSTATLISQSPPVPVDSYGNPVAMPQPAFSFGQSIPQATAGQGMSPTGQLIQAGGSGGLASPGDGDLTGGAFNLSQFGPRPSVDEGSFGISPGLLLVGGIIAFLLLTGKRSHAE